MHICATVTFRGTIRAFTSKATYQKSRPNRTYADQYGLLSFFPLVNLRWGCISAGRHPDFGLSVRHEDAWLITPAEGGVASRVRSSLCSLGLPPLCPEHFRYGGSACRARGIVSRETVGSGATALGVISRTASAATGQNRTTSGTWMRPSLRLAARSSGCGAPLMPMAMFSISWFRLAATAELPGASLAPIQAIAPDAEHRPHKGLKTRIENSPGKPENARKSWVSLRVSKTVRL